MPLKNDLEEEDIADVLRSVLQARRRASIKLLLARKRAAPRRTNDGYIRHAQYVVETTTRERESERNKSDRIDRAHPEDRPAKRRRRAARVFLPSRAIFG